MRLKSHEQDEIVRTILASVTEPLGFIYIFVIYATGRALRTSDLDIISDEQWDLIAEDLKHPREGKPSRGRPPVPARKILEAVLWILRTGAQWVELPKRYPPYQTVHRRYQEWNINGQLTTALKTLAQHLEKKGKLDLFECAIDGTFAAAKKGLRVGKTKRGKGTKIMAITDNNGIPIAARIERASPAEVTLVHDTLDARWVRGLPFRMLGDKAYDSDKLDAELAAIGI